LISTSEELNRQFSVLAATGPSSRVVHRHLFKIRQEPVSRRAWEHVLRQWQQTNKFLTTRLPSFLWWIILKTLLRY